MIELYEGRLGGGKTYSACVRMVDQVARGGLIATNIEIVWDKFSEYIQNKFNVVPERDQFISLQDEQIGLFHRFTPSGTAELPVLVVIDEAHLTFNARDFAQTDKLYRETLTFLTQSRKVNTDIIFIAQSVLNMDKQFMRLVQFIWRFRDLAKWKIPGLGIPYPLKQILAVQFDYDGKTVLQRSFVQKDKRIFGLYNTNSLIREFPRLEAITTKRTLTKAKSRKEQMKLLIPLGIVLGVISAFFLYKKISNIGKASTPAVASTSAKPTPASSVNTTASSVTTKANEKEKEKNNGAYDIYDEEFRSWNAPDRTLGTAEGGWYQAGEMSGRGFVTATSARRARIAQPDGRTGWVVATRYAKAPVAFAPTPTPTPSFGASPAVSASPIGTTSPTASPASIVTPSPTPTPFPVYRNGVPIGGKAIPTPTVSPTP
jgi:zona occludens toxin (predicted ATPase)